MTSSKQGKKNTIRTTAFRSLFHALIPRKANDFHPHLIRRGGLVAVLVVVAALQLWTNVPTAGSVLGAKTDFSKQTLLTESNKVREQNDIPLLNLNNDLSAAAGLKARDMLVRQYWAHTSPDGTTPWYWFREVNYRYDYAGENLAKGFETPSGVITAWMNSEEHRRNALSKDYQDVGFGVAEGTLDGETTTVVVALYGSPLGAPDIASTQVLAASDGDINLVTRFGVGLQSLNPTTLGSIALLFITLVVGLLAHISRNKLPLSMRKSWKRHHALYKSLGMACLILALITLYGGGQIL